MTTSTPGPQMPLATMLDALVEYAKTQERYEQWNHRRSLNHWKPQVDWSNTAHDAEAHVNRLKQAILDQYGREGE